MDDATPMAVIDDTDETMHDGIRVFDGSIGIRRGALENVNGPLRYSRKTLFELCLFVCLFVYSSMIK